ncbi:hypothetical protein EDC55_10329 [Allofrancisella inopinata]|uniref:Uncharacterized protein n=1 Tax=Allofrancisella inopinata TaxID=1085647 RepID=A0AAE7CR75_9GAMM|nr:hypothetical protein [Allofrancisella inopinata]QIV96705.1 hypothetical protein E4K63_07630 [Allofrancisella inopinata]TDT73460.1 hypothetical protein EDC55_10329 [Allofrancisella inopinata]
MDEENINDLILLNVIKEVSQDKLIDLVYTEKFNDLFKRDGILEKMLPIDEKLLDNIDLNKKWHKSLIEKLLPNTYLSLAWQSIKLKIIPLDEKFSLQVDKSIEVNSFYIQDLKLSLETKGFCGHIDFVYPYQTEYDNKLMDILADGLPFQLEILIKQEFFLESDQKEFIEKNGDLGNEEIKFTAYSGNHETKETLIRSPEFDLVSGKINSPLVKCDALYKISFCDAMSFFWKQLNPVCIYSGQSYNDIFIEQNAPFEKLVKLIFDKSSETTLKQKLPFICMNCEGGSCEDGFLGYVSYILEQYNLLLLYDYISATYTITSDYSSILSKAKPVKGILKEDKQRIQSIRYTYNKPYLPEKTLINVNPNSAAKQQLKVTELDDIPKTIDSFKQDHTTQHDVNNLFKLKIDNCQARLKNKFAAKNTGLEINSSSLACSYSIFPLQNTISLASEEWSLILGKSDKNMVLHKVDLNFEKTPLYAKNNKRHPLAYEDRQEGKILEDKISFEFEDKLLKNNKLPLMFNCHSKLYLYNKELWPKNKSYLASKALKISGHIFATKSDDEKATHTSELFNYTADSSKGIAANESYSCSDKIATLDPNAVSRPRYQVKVAPQLWTKLTPENKRFVPADMTLLSYSNILFYLKSGTEVEIKLFQEHANVTKIKSYIAPENMFTAGDKEQNQGIIFENRKEQLTMVQNTYVPGDKTSSFKISHCPTDNGTASNLEMNNKSFKISVDCKK